MQGQTTFSCLSWLWHNAHCVRWPLSNVISFSYQSIDPRLFDTLSLELLAAQLFVAFVLQQRLLEVDFPLGLFHID